MPEPVSEVVNVFYPVSFIHSQAETHVEKKQYS